LVNRELFLGELRELRGQTQIGTAGTGRKRRDKPA
jgi:hypothetical protein